jgi:hypothetical protein
MTTMAIAIDKNKRIIELINKMPANFHPSG